MGRGGEERLCLADSRWQEWSAVLDVFGFYMEALLSPTESYYIPGATQAVENSTKIRLYGGSASSLVSLPLSWFAQIYT